MLKQIKNYFSRLFFTKAKQRAFLEDVCALIADGVPAQQAINVIFKVSTGPVKEAAQAILIAVAQGRRIAEGMEGWFPRPIVEIIRNGEEGGSLAATLLTAVRTLSEQISVTSTLFASTTYPLVVLGLACGVCVFLKNFIFATFASIKPVELWPDNGKLFMVIATTIQYWWWAVILGIIAVIFILIQLMRNLVGEPRKLLDNILPFTLYREFVAAHFMEILGLLIASGISFRDALNTIQCNATRYLAWHIYMMQFRLSGGKENLAEVLDTGLVGSADIERLRAIAQSKSFEHALIQLGNQSAKRNVQTLRTASKVFGGLLLALDAGFAIFMIFAVYGVGMVIGTQ
jgi:toxin coregulated pilus biosynthesis protein E